jgi:GR25 family glycosyltransferase involved in LPS biosynthesis
MFAFKTYYFDDKKINIDKINFEQTLTFSKENMAIDDDDELLKFVKASSIFHCNNNNILLDDSNIQLEYWSKHFSDNNRSFNLHHDKNEGLFVDNSLAKNEHFIKHGPKEQVYPVLTICSYFNDILEPIIICNPGPDSISYSDGCINNTVDTQSVHFPSQPAVAAIFPKKNTQIVFKGGDFLHGCIPLSDKSIMNDRRIIVINIWKRKSVRIDTGSVINHSNSSLLFKLYLQLPNNVKQAVLNKNHHEMIDIFKNMDTNISSVWICRLKRVRLWDIDTGFYDIINEFDFSMYSDSNISESNQNIQNYNQITEFKLTLQKQYTPNCDLISDFLKFNTNQRNKHFLSLFNIENINYNYYYLLTIKNDVNFYTKQKYNFKLISVSTDDNHPGFRNFIYSVNKYKIPHKIIGLDSEWNGGNLEKETGGGHKVNLLKKELATWSKDELKNTIVLFTDSYDVFFTEGETAILNKYYDALDKYNYINTILFSAEKDCWPDSGLSKSYTNNSTSNYLYLNSGSFIGTAANINNLLVANSITNKEDDQLFYTHLHLSDQFNIKCQLDYKCRLFQTLNNSIQDLTVYNNEIYNVSTTSYPCIIHGNGPRQIKTFLNYIFTIFKNNNIIYYRGNNLFNKSFYKIQPISIPTFIINMPRSTGRRTHMTAKIENDTGLRDWRFFVGVDGKKDLQQYNFRLGSKLQTNTGEIGCFLSHLKLWKHIYESNIEHALVLEDDTIFLKNFNFYLNSILQNIDSYKAHDIIKINNFKNINNVVCFDELMINATHIYNTSSYIISKTGAAKLLNLDPINNIIAVDDYLNNLSQTNKINAIATKFNLCDQEYRSVCPSTIETTEIYTYKPYIK